MSTVTPLRSRRQLLVKAAVERDITPEQCPCGSEAAWSLPVADQAGDLLFQCQNCGCTLAIEKRAIIDVLTRELDTELNRRPLN